MCTAAVKLVPIIPPTYKREPRIRLTPGNEKRNHSYLDTRCHCCGCWRKVARELSASSPERGNDAFLLYGRGIPGIYMYIVPGIREDTYLLQELLCFDQAQIYHFTKQGVSLSYQYINIFIFIQQVCCFRRKVEPGTCPIVTVLSTLDYLEDLQASSRGACVRILLAEFAKARFGQCFIPERV